MCGIAGAIRKISPDPTIRTRSDDGAALQWAQRMTEAQRHRGPDGSGLWQSAGAEVVFGHRRLAILDLSEAGAQPMVDEASGCAVTFNGEIYNFPEVRRDLEALGDVFRSTSDTEVILKAYRTLGSRRGRAVPRHLRPGALGSPFPCRPPRAGPDGHQAALLGRRPARRVGRGDPALRFRGSRPSGERRGAAPARSRDGGVYLWHGFAVGPGHDDRRRASPSRGLDPHRRGQRRAAALETPVGRDSTGSCPRRRAVRPRPRTCAASS